MKNNLNEFEKFTESLYRESPRGAFELESMKYGIMARIGLQEPEALELAVKIVAANKKTKGVQPMDDKFDVTAENMSDQERAEVEKTLANIRAQRQAAAMAPKIEAYKAAMIAARGKGQRVGQEIKAKYRAQGVDVDNIGFSV